MDEFPFDMLNNQIDRCQYISVRSQPLIRTAAI